MMLQRTERTSDRLRTYDDAVAYLESLGVSEDKIVEFDLVAGSRFTRDALEGRFDRLKSRGFADPVKMIVSLPAILGLAFENIDAKLRFGRRLKKWNVDPIKMIEEFPPLLGYSMKRFFFCLRFIACLDDGRPEIIFHIITKKPDALAAALFLRGPPIWDQVRPEIKRKKDAEENAALIAANATTVIARAYRKYKGARA